MRQYGPFLVIVPLSTITAWQSQFASWAPDINVVTYIGTAAAREVIRVHEFGPSNKKLRLNVLLTTYEITLRDAKELGDIKWQLLAVDEVRFTESILLLPNFRVSQRFSTNLFVISLCIFLVPLFPMVLSFHCFPLPPVRFDPLTWLPPLFDACFLVDGTDAYLGD